MLKQTEMYKQTVYCNSEQTWCIFARLSPANFCNWAQHHVC